MTAVEFAKAMDYDYSTVMRWLRRGLVPGAEFMPVSESGKFGIWRIPQSALQMEKPRPGRRRDEPKKLSGRAKKLADAAQASLFEPTTVARPVRKAGAKKSKKGAGK